MTSKLSTVVWIYLSVSQVIQFADSANIVFFFGVSSYSHRIPAWPLAEELAERSHNVTFVSPYSAKSPNPKIFDYVPVTLKKWVDSWGDIENVFEDRKKGDWSSVWITLPTFGIMMCEVIYADEEFVRWVKSTKVDVLIIDALGNDCAYGMAHYWGAKVILFDTAAPFGYFSETYGLPDETSWIPSMELAYPTEMSFSQRLTNAVLPLAWQYYRKWYFFPSLAEITSDKLGITNLPKFEELERNTSLVFLNTHYGEEFARSLPPNIISVGGIAYTGKTKPLPKDMEDFLEKGDGFIYMSFGTYAEFSKFDTSIQQAFIGAMQNLPHIQFLWKVENVSLIEEFPKKNVYIGKWMPQQDILAHPKIRAFITHAGLIGIQEAIYNSVPLISFPIFADQDYNGERIHRKECGIRMEILTITQPLLEEAIQKILGDEKYRNNMKKISEMFADRPLKPLETALWWTDFVIRHSKEDLSALRPLNIAQSGWKRRQLDVWAAIIVALLIFMFLLSYAMYRTMKYFTKTKSSSAKSKQKASTRRKKVQ